MHLSHATEPTRGAARVSVICTLHTVAIRRRDGRRFALKLISMDGRDSDDAERMDRKEVGAMHAGFGHRHIVRLFCSWRTETVYYLQMELVVGEDLYDYIQSRLDRCLNKCLNELDLWLLFAQMVCALAHLNACGWVHGDLKPKNIMLTHSGRRVKLIDFGHAQKIEDLCDRPIGTFDFNPPEMLSDQAYDVAHIDVWSLGVVLYFMCKGLLPFYHQDARVVEQRSLTGKYKPLSPVRFSENLRNLVHDHLLVADTTLRIRMGEIAQHAWLLPHSASGASLSPALSPGP
jgi:serine/threonine protein kinase